MVISVKKNPTSQRANPKSSYPVRAHSRHSNTGTANSMPEQTSPSALLGLRLARVTPVAEM